MKSKIITTPIEGYISDNTNIEPSLTKKGKIQGVLNPVFQISGPFNNGQTKVIEGNISLEASLKGNLQQKTKEIVGKLKALSPQLSGNVRIPFVERNEIYSGAYEVIPSFSEQTLLTGGKILNNNIKVLQIMTYETSNDFGTTFII